MSNVKETAVQTYLAFLENPAGINRELIADLENQLSTAVSPIVKLRLLAEIDRARTSGKAGLEEGFVRHANAWAAENGIPAHAFLALGVDLDLLAKAGFDPLPTPQTKPGGKGSKSKDSGKRSGSVHQKNGKPRAQSVNSETVEKLILTTTDPFSVRDIVDLSHATNATVSRVVGWLVAAKKLEKIGSLAPQGSRGIAPIGYQMKKPRKS